MAKKLSPVPENGTQPATYTIAEPSPKDKMIYGPQKKSSNKKPTSFNLDPEIFKQFKKDCIDKGMGMSSVIEGFMIQFHQTGLPTPTQSPNK